MGNDIDLLTPLQAARHLGITPELLTAYARPSFRKGAAAARRLKAISTGGRVRYARVDLDEFDEYLRQPWSDVAEDRPKVPDAVIRHLVAESLNQCVRCGSGSAVQTAHIDPWAATRSHHHHNLLRLCVACHSAHDADGSIPTDELRDLKERLIARTRASLDRRMGDPSNRFRPPRRSREYHGRSQELDDLVVALQAGRSLVINGAGGIGKTELLLQALDRAESGRAVIWIDVGQYRDAAAIEEALHIAVSMDADPLGTAELAVRLDEMNACIVLDGIEQGTLTDLETLERRMSELSLSSHIAQFVATSQILLHRFPSDETITLGPLDDVSGELILLGSVPSSKGSGSNATELLRICAGHALTLHLASALIKHYGSIASATRVVRERGAPAVSMPGVTAHDRSTSLSVCLSLAFEALSPVERKSLLLIAMAPAGLFARQLEDDFFDIGGGLDALASLRRWHLTYSDEDPQRERLQTLPPIRMFVIQRLAADESEESERLKSKLLQSIAMMVGVIEERSSESEQIDYMIARYSEDMPNIRWLIDEAELNPTDSGLSLLASATCSSLMRYFFVLRLSEEGAILMRRAAELALAGGRPDRAASFVTQMIGLARRYHSNLIELADSLMVRIEATGPLPLWVEGDLQTGRAMIAMDFGDPMAAAVAANQAFECFKAARQIVAVRRDDDPEDLTELPDDLIASRDEECHNGMASALRLHGDAMLAQGNFERARENYKHSLRHERGASIAVNRGQILHQIGNCESNLGNHDVAAECYLDAIARFYVVGMQEFLSNGTGELGFELLDCDPPRLREIPDEVMSAAMDDLTSDFVDCLDLPRGIEPQRCIGLARKTFGTLNVSIMTGRAREAGDWAFRVATDVLNPVFDTLPPEEAERGTIFSGLVLQNPLHLAFLVADLEDSVDETGTLSEGRMNKFLAGCCAIDSWNRSVLRLPDWLATYLTRRLGVINVTRERVAEYMVNYDDDVADHLDLEWPQR